MEEESQKKNKKHKIKKSQKPITVSNRKPFNIFDKNNKTQKPLVRDPRFSNLSGSFNPNFFRNAYKFLYDTREHEKEEIEKKLKNKNLNQEEKNKLKNAYSNYKNTDAILKKKEDERKLKSQLVKQEKENILKKNKTPYYYSNRTIKKMVQEKGEEKIGVKKIIKKEKKILQKERKHNMIPQRRYVDEN
ncbi:hypothetical protein YYC_02315 [Plasmodium yoelii 17X]|uniref:rRNA biogenesis protein RRP36 n=3 Tax=Plasmodium yoelii TaxID=5861 RepID=A0AAE9WJN9_PLAYO|nr:rRNA biogenesis protein RRP36, putative [Plasmodium yoelii]ETB60696.1 hypothetical protein YYC_02315 [Plasmodium yoelii 17X]WBY54701.1 rRNA biogenesis protein RRP36 [Plasmodium yoelii yoelii]CDU16067.1 conserved protein, unknown function [Plasmodium yoelii]VTZ71692.1 rRNA biogenesis protein RRP36, putative [Plasmodium yoelii]|eukprot:XP_022811342.1 rRNA biogenesis protein RRP36, putative [Plasmodium yoelii]